MNTPDEDLPSSLENAMAHAFRADEGDSSPAASVAIDASAGEIATLWAEEAAYLHGEYRKAGREFKFAFAEVVAESERCASSRLDAVCSELLDLLR